MAEVSSTSGGIQFTPGYEVEDTQVAQGGSSSSGISTIQKSDKEFEEEMSQLLPKPWIDFAMALTLWQNMDQNAGLAGVISSTDRSKFFGVMEGSIILSMADVYVKNQQQMAEQVKDDEKKKQANPLQTLIALYAEKGINLTEDMFQTLQMLRGSKALFAGINTVNPSLLLQAFHLAESQLVLQLLSKWMESDQKLREFMREREKHLQATQPSVSQTMLQDYLHNIKTGQERLSQPVLTVMLVGVVSGSPTQVPLQVDPTGKVSFDARKDSLGPVGQNVVFDLVQSIGEELGPEFQPAMTKAALDCATLTSNVLLSASYWSVPGAVTLASAMKAEVDQGADLPSVQSYALTIAAFTGRADFAEMLKNRVLKHINLETLSQDRLNVIISSWKVTLLANALAALDKTITGGVIIRKEDMMQLIGKEIPLAEADRRASLVTLINAELKKIEEIDPSRKNELLARLYKYFDTNPQIAELTNPGTVFVLLSDPKFAREANLQQRG